MLLVTLYFPPATAYGGPVRSAAFVSEVIGQRGHEVQVLTTNGNGQADLGPDVGWRPFAQGVTVRYCKRWGSGLFAPRMAWDFVRSARRADLVYVWGFFVWLMPLIVLVCRAMRLPLIVSPRGMLQPAALQVKPVRKRLMLGVCRALGMTGLAEFHATSAEEADAVREVLGEVAGQVIPNGVEVPDAGSEGEPPLEGVAGTPYVLYLGRLHPFKQVDCLIRAAASLKRRGELGMHVCIAGAGEAGYLQTLRDLARTEGVGDDVIFVGPVEGRVKSSLLAHARALVLPSRSESFGLSVAEALAHGTPAIAVKTAPWSGLVGNRCGWWIEESEDELASALREAMTMDQDRRTAMGERGRAWAAREFESSAVGARLAGWFESVAARQPT
ncbi:MAG TPA: glycosyltransferase [Thermoanaerobaculaceae bacterium]|nr:glycosyltransferase [Thermoanaerobaculaceae bacterium]